MPKASSQMIRGKFSATKNFSVATGDQPTTFFNPLINILINSSHDITEKWV
jgi:hypothetical protein